MMRRGEAPLDGAPLESQIDLRVIQRWFLSQAAAGKPESEVQIAAMLRVMQLASATTQLEEAMKTLEGRGVNFHDILDEGKAGKFAHFRDRTAICFIWLSSTGVM